MKRLNIFRNDSDRGFTLLELMVALAILAVGILSIMGMFSYSVGGNAQGKHVTEATNLAQSRLDYLASAAIYENLADGSSTNGIYTISWHIDQPITTPALADKLKMITVTVSWQTKGFAHSVKLETLRSKGSQN